MTDVSNTNIVGGTEQSELVTATVNGVTIGTFNSADGGDAYATATQNRSGGQANMTSYRTRPKYTELNVSRVVNLAVDWEVIRGLIPLAGLVPGSVTIQPLDTDLNAYGNPRTATGMFLGVGGVRIDSNSEALQNFTLRFSVDVWQ